MKTDPLSIEPFKLLKSSKNLTIEQVTWITTKSYLDILYDELKNTCWIISIPHWFNEKILIELLPEIKPKSSIIYQELTRLPFVKSFLNRGHSFRSLTRKLMLSYLWDERRQDYLQKSLLAMNFFKYYADKYSFAQIEFLYHAVIVDIEKAIKEIEMISIKWQEQNRLVELEFLVNILSEHIKEERLTKTDKINQLRILSQICFDINLQNKGENFLSQVKEQTQKFDNKKTIHTVANSSQKKLNKVDEAAKAIYWGTGRRKSSVARVRLVPGNGTLIVNDKDGETYFNRIPNYLVNAKAPLEILGLENEYDILVKAHGGGLTGQSDAVKLGVARALCELSPENRQILKKEGYLTRDPRAKERKKYGLHKARKAPQYSKR